LGARSELVVAAVEECFELEAAVVVAASA